MPSINNPSVPLLNLAGKMAAGKGLYILILCLSLTVVHTVNPANTLPGYSVTAAQPAGRKQVLLYYFYFVPRCDECLLLDKALEELLEKHYRNEMQNGRLVFRRINLSDPDMDEEAIIRELRIRRQLLLLVSDGETINLTRDAFRFVERDNERFRQSVMNPLNGMLR